MIMKGQKRKLPPEDTAFFSENASAELDGQRQIVLYISLNKYQRGQELAEPSLRRSVLIANTLRRITSQASSISKAAVEKDGGSPAPCGAATALQSEESGVTGTGFTPNGLLTVGDVSSSPANQHENGVPSSRPQVNFHAMSPPNVCTGGDSSEDWESMSSDPDFSLSAAISSILTSLESSIDGNPGASPPTPRTPLRSVENLAAPEGEGASKQQQGVRGLCWGGWERAEESRTMDSCVEVMRSSYLGDLALDDLFQDIDTSLLERELGTLGSRGEGHEDLLKYLPSLSSSATPPSLSFSSSPFLSFNQNLWCLPSFSSGFNSSTTSATASFFSFASPSPSSSSYPGQGLARDGLELDHLMEVLVES
ncbi:hypothetical protein NHX12_008591 [Muraenolepis orangiensis]|uniref:SERTA domain-containing protein n=1 Tax=Muraenolepis orangiensis TaxID=630683 RepID=A0A9Q0DN52_9TELE|nr:hypothetical protein NHX12_008591 [Muraenolepis orangiensis]